MAGSLLDLNPDVIGSVFQVAEKHYGTIMAWSMIKTMGRRVFPTIAKTVGFPKELRTLLDWIKWKGHTFLDDQRGSDVVPRKFIRYEGILEMCNIRSYNVKQTRGVKKGAPVCEYDITWNET